MYVVQLAVEGLRGFPRRSRFGFRGHLDVIRLTSAEARADLIDVFFNTLFPDPDRTEATRDLAVEDHERRRSVMTLAGRDRVPYRMMRELSSGQCRLYRFDKQKGTHVVLSEDSREAHQFLRVQLQLPDDASYERLFLFAADARPSRGTDARSRSGAPMVPGQSDIAPSGPGLLSGAPGAAVSGTYAAYTGGSGGSAPAEGPRKDLTAMFPLPSVLREATGVHSLPSGFSMHNALVQQELQLSATGDLDENTPDDDLRARYRGLQEELKLEKRRARAERTLDALEEKERLAEEARRAFEELSTAIAQLDDAIEVERELHGLPSGFRDRLDRHEALDARHRGERDRIGEELAQARRLVADSPERGWLQEPWILLGVPGAVVSAALASLFSLSWLAALQVALGTLAGASALRNVGRRERRMDALARVEALEERAAKAERQHMLDTSTVRGILSQLGVSDPYSLAHRLAALEKLVNERKGLVARAEGDVGRRGRRALEVLPKIAARKADCLNELNKYEDGGPSEELLARRIKSVEEELTRRGLPVDADPIAVVRGTVEAGTAAAQARPASSLGSVLPAFDDDDGEDGYDDGYGQGGNPAGSGSQASSQGDGGGLWCVGGYAGSGGGGSSGASSYGAGGGVSDRSRMLLETAADLLGHDLEELMEAVRPRVERYVQALSSRRFEKAWFHPSATLLLAGARGEQAYSELDGDLLDQVDASLRFALLESVLRVRRAPVLIEEPVASLPRERRGVVKRIYSHLASMAQVVVITPASDLDGHTVHVEG